MFQMFQRFYFLENKLRNAPICEWPGELLDHNVLLTDSVPGVTLTRPVSVSSKHSHVSFGWRGRKRPTIKAPDYRSQEVSSRRIWNIGVEDGHRVAETTDIIPCRDLNQLIRHVLWHEIRHGVSGAIKVEEQVAFVRSYELLWPVLDCRLQRYA